MSAGISPEAETRVSADLIEWADVVLVMEKVHRRKLNERFKPHLKAIENLWYWIFGTITASWILNSCAS